MDDNARPHSVCITNNFLRQQGTEWMVWARELARSEPDRTCVGSIEKSPVSSCEWEHRAIRYASSVAGRMEEYSTTKNCPSYQQHAIPMLAGYRPTRLLSNKMSLLTILLFLKTTPLPFNRRSVGRHATRVVALGMYCVYSSTNRTWTFSSKFTQYIR